MRTISVSSAKHFSLNFCRCGLVGWCIECFWTGLGALCHHKKDKRLLCRTSVWMFPIYGLAAFLPLLYRVVKKCSVCVRGIVYAISILFCEFLTGSFLKKMKACPWDYSGAKLNYKGVIRFDYVPCWALAGLLFERLLCKRSGSKK